MLCVTCARILRENESQENVPSLYRETATKAVVVLNGNSLCAAHAEEIFESETCNECNGTRNKHYLDCSVWQIDEDNTALSRMLPHRP